MGLILKHIVSTKAGTFHYRRRIPKDAAEAIGRSEFKRLLGQTEREALRNYPKVHAEFERVVEDARKGAARNLADLTPLEVHRLAQRRAAELEAMTVYVGDSSAHLRDAIGGDRLSSQFVFRDRRRFAFVYRDGIPRRKFALGFVITLGQIKAIPGSKGTAKRGPFEGDKLPHRRTIPALTAAPKPISG
jgi:hypothetical protein